MLWEKLETLWRIAQKCIGYVAQVKIIIKY